MPSRLSALASVLVFCSFAFAEGPEPIRIADDLRLTWGKRKELKFQIETLPEAYRALVYFLGRQDAKRLGGSAHMLALHLNKVQLTGERLANKSNELVMGSGAIGHWYGGRGWRLLYSPDYMQGDGPTEYAGCVVTGNAYEFMIDVTDLLRTGENTLAVRHLWQGPWNDIVLKDLSIVFRKPEGLYAKPGAEPEAPKGPLPFIKPHPVQPMKFSAEIGSEGAIVLRCGGRTYRIESNFTHKDDWETQETSATRMRAKCKYYDFRREIQMQAECLDVRDRLTNLSDRDIGIVVTHTCRFNPAKAREQRIGGLRPFVSAMRRHSTGNQTTFVSLKDGGLGLLPRDDVFKAHSDNFYEKGVIGLEDRFFVLPVGASYTMRWSIFPVPSGNYYDFINAARRTLKVNFTFDGAMGFCHYVRWMENITPEDAKQWAEARSLRYISGVIPKNPKTGLYYHGSAMLLPGARERLQLFRAILTRIQTARPGSFGIQYYHCYISTEPGAAEKYSDSVCLDAKGKQQNYRNPIYPIFVPTLSNSYGKAMQKVLDLLLDDIKFDGIYWDEMSQSCGRFVYDFPVWDGHTGQLKREDGTILRKMSEVTLIAQPFRAAMVKRIMSGGRPLIANGPPVTETMMQYHFPRFTETGGLTHLYNVHLFTPIGLGDHLTERTPLDIARQIRRHLDFGCVYYFYRFEPRLDHCMLPQYMYPITPLELHEGYIIAKERILTNRSGIYGWGDESKHEVHVFNEKGKEIPFEAKRFEKGGATWTELRLPTHYVGAIVRR
ncbi:MAG: hypothetical protein GXP25_23910 [Planctomycetes bacterium]|nr:hypothetical protein [Planctomycetota bacterium]